MTHSEYIPEFDLIFLSIMDFGIFEYNVLYGYIKEYGGSTLGFNLLLNYWMD